jgi:Thioesterase-like superfamily
MSMHPFDQALQLQSAGSDRPHTWVGETSPAYWNMVGPFGGSTAATALRAVLLHPDLLGEPIALTVNYAAATAAGAFSITARPVRTNRSTQHWTIELTQADASGNVGVVLTATAITAVRRSTWSASEIPMPDAPLAGAAPRPKLLAPEWTQRYDMRVVRGTIPQEWDGAEQSSLMQLWVRDEPPRALDFTALAAMVDVFYPRIWLRRAIRVPAGTVSITTYFHAGGTELETVGTGYLLAQAKAQTFHNGFFDQTAQVWSSAGLLLATSNQIVYYKE